MRPSYWGKYFWKVIHITALAYPDNPSEQNKQDYITFFETMGKVLPCKRCSNNYTGHLRNLPIENFMDSPDDLFKWTVHLHNIVSKELGKPQWNVEYAKSYYKAEEHKAYQQEKPSVCTTTVISPQEAEARWSSSILSALLIIINIIFIVFIAVFLWKRM